MDNTNKLGKISNEFINFALKKDDLQSSLDSIAFKNNSEISFDKDAKDQCKGTDTRVFYEYQQGYVFDATD